MLASCSDAFVLAPLARPGALGGCTVRFCWLGSATERHAAQELGLPGEAAADASPQPGEVILLAGHGRAVQTWALQARHAGAVLVRWNAGQRAHDAAQAEDADRRLCDHLAHGWLCASDHQRDELRREGFDDARIAVVGSLVPQALAGLPACERGAPFAWLALEHRRSVASREALRTLLVRVAAATAAHGLPVRAAATVVGPALAEHGIDAPAGIELVDASAEAQLAAARAARVVLTDSAGHQELAAAAGVPCLVLQGSTARPETLASGASRLADHDDDLGAILAQALATAAVPPPLVDALPLLPTALERVLAPAAPPGPRPAAAGLPQDGDHTGRTLGADEAALVAAAIRRGTLNSTRGTFVAEFERRFAAWHGRKHAIACASGSAAMHCAIAALELAAGDEVVTTPITDMGALTPILYQGAVPVFADVDPHTLCVTAASIEAQLTDRTRAIVVTHLFGRPADLDGIAALAERRGLPLIEDCAQAFGATWRGRKVGTHGALAAFSLQQGKHITTGEGGLVTTDDDALARRVFLFVNKAWGYGDPKPDHTFPALNYRLTELQGAVATAQLGKLDWVVERRRAVAAALRSRLAGLPGLTLPGDPPHGTHSYWKFALDVDAGVLPGGAVALGKGLHERGIACAPRYVQKPAYACALFVGWRRWPVMQLALSQNPRGAAASPWPAAGALPGATQGLDRVLVLPINERYTEAHVAQVATAIRARTEELLRG